MRRRGDRIVIPAGGCSCAGTCKPKRRKKGSAAATAGRLSGSTDGPTPEVFLARVRRSSSSPATVPAERVELLRRAGLPADVVARIVSSTRYR